MGGRSRETKVSNFDSAIIGQENIFWFEVAVHDSGAVGSVEPMQDSAHDIQRLCWS